MSEADDVYMGYAGRDELLASLGQLLTAGEIGDAQRAVLAGHVRALGGTPITGAGRHEPGRAISVLRALLPRVRDGALHADLTRILQSLEEDGRREKRP